MLGAVEVPRVLPLDHLSVTSVTLFMRCPEKWRRRYLEREYEPAGGGLIAGGAAHAAEAQHYGTVIETGDGLATADVLDLFADEWRARVEREDRIDWGRGETEQTARSAGEGALRAYHTLIAPTVQPVSVERAFTLRFPGAEWDFTGFMDLEEADDAVSDLKVVKRRMAQSDADGDLQATAYLAARRAEDNPAREFRFHTAIKNRTPTAEVVSTSRTDAQLDGLLDRLVAVAAEMAWRVEMDVWDGAPPGAWWCGRFCGYWRSCPFGGAA